ncbi:uncharacterized protein LOC116266404 isoform X1 [Nymphaea colorata]|nr:uncharacterized protein LOC116266404 isoform X1 [Nymphaea colorata]XP_031503472.1 uncharacterized protein LOC116266404 isoform X1 [Nymphaea colorata]
MATSIPSARSRFGDTTFTKIFVGGLAWETQSRGLQKHFEQFGEILEAAVIIDKKSGRSKGYGFVTFRDPEAARRACLDPNPVIDGRRANCNLASLGCSQPPPPAAHSEGIYFRSSQAPHPYRGISSHLQPFPYGYQQRVLYYPYGYVTYRDEHLYSHGHGPPVAYGGYHYPQLFARNPHTNSSVPPFIQPNYFLVPGHGYDSQQGSGVPDQSLPHSSPQDVDTVTIAQPSGDVHSTSQSPSASTASPQSIVPAHGEEYMQGATGLESNIT